MKLIIFSWCIWFDQPTYFVKQEALICQHRSKIVNWEHGKYAISHLAFAWNQTALSPFSISYLRNLTAKQDWLPEMTFSWFFPNKACFNLSKYDVGLSSARLTELHHRAKAAPAPDSHEISLKHSVSRKTVLFLVKIGGKLEQIDNCQRWSTGSALGTSKPATLPGAAESSKLH